MLRPDEELRYDLNWTDCFFIYKPREYKLKNNKQSIVNVPEENGRIFFLIDPASTTSISSIGSTTTTTSSNMVMLLICIYQNNINLKYY